MREKNECGYQNDCDTGAICVYVHDGGNQGLAIADVPVSLLCNNKLLLPPQSTLANGYTTFSNLLPGDYVVKCDWFKKQIEANVQKGKTTSKNIETNINFKISKSFQNREGSIIPPENSRVGPEVGDVIVYECSVAENWANCVDYVPSPDLRPDPENLNTNSIKRFYKVCLEPGQVKSTITLKFRCPSQAQATSTIRIHTQEDVTK